MEYLKFLINSYRHYIDDCSDSFNEYDFSSGYHQGSLKATKSFLDELILLEGYLKNENEEECK